MPVEIRELHIRTEVGSPPQESRTARSEAGADPEQEQEALIAICVERVMEILRQREER